MRSKRKKKKKKTADGERNNTSKKWDSAGETFITRGEGGKEGEEKGKKG